MHRPLAFRGLWLALLVAGSEAFAHNPGCEIFLSSARPLTAKLLREQSKARIQRVETHTPRPGFDNLESESRVEQVGEAGPLSLLQTLGRGGSFVSTPEPTSADPTTVGLIDEVRSRPVHVDVEWHGRRTSTTVFASLPRVSRNTDYLVGPEYPAVLVHLHGGGTPSATGKNGVNIGDKLMAKGIPVLSPTLPGHGRATRNPQNLMSMREQAEWLMELIEQEVHPGVKVILSGHSWGGMFTIFMHRLSSEQRFSRISRFISLSPGVDTSLGGSAEERVAFDQWWEKNFPSFKDRIAPADFEFQENVLSNGKEADIPSYFTGLSNLDYWTPPLTQEVMRNLKPLTVVVGSADGVVYVGREEQFEKVFGQLSGDSQLIVLGPGRTWKSKTADDLIPTGHNIFDRYIDGTTNYQVYSMLSDLVEKEAGGVMPEVKGDRAEDVLDQIGRHYSNFFAFRELVDHQVEFVTMPTPELARVSARKVALDNYFRKVEEVKAKAKKMADERAVKALGELRSAVGLTDSISVERARTELSWPELTEARKGDLERFLHEVDEMDRKLKVSFSDPESDAELEKLKTEFADILAQLGITELEDYAPHFERLGKMKLKGPEEKLRSELSRLHQKYTQIQKVKQNRFSVERDAHLAAMTPPMGVSDFRSANRELRGDRTPARRKALADFVARSAEVESAARAGAEFETAKQIENLPKPEGVTSLENARLLQAETDQRLRSIYVPPGASEAVRKAAGLVIELDEKFVAAYQGSVQGDLSLDRLETLVRELRDKRAQLTKRWDALWAKGILDSPRLRKAQASYEHTLAGFKEIYFSYEEMKSARLLELKGRNQLTTAAVVAQTPELLRARARYQHAKKVFLEAREARDQVLFNEAAAGSLEGPPNAVKDAMKIASDLGPTSELLKAREDHLDGLRQRLSVLQKQIEEQKYIYALAMQEQRFEVPYAFGRFNIYEELNRPYDVVIRILRSNPYLLEALTKVLNRWDGFLTEIRRENASSARAEGGY